MLSILYFVKADWRIKKKLNIYKIFDKGFNYTMVSRRVAYINFIAKNKYKYIITIMFE